MKNIEEIVKTLETVIKDVSSGKAKITKKDIKLIESITDDINKYKAEDTENKRQELLAEIKNIANSISGIEVKPQVNVPDVKVNVPEIKLPKIVVPEIKSPNVTVPPIKVPKINTPNVKVNVDKVKVTKPEWLSEVNKDLLTKIEELKKLIPVIPTDAKKPMSVRLSDGQKFYRVMGSLISAMSSSLIFKDSDNTAQAALVDEDGHQQVDIVTIPNVVVKGVSTANNQLSGNQTTQVVDSENNNIGGKFYDTVTETYKGLQFNGIAPQICSQDYLLALGEGDIPGHTAFTKFGRVSNVNNTLVDVWVGEGGVASIYVFPPSAAQLHIVSSSANDDLGNTGIEKILIVGLDENYAEISEEVTMDGTNIVTTTKSFLRINSCYATQAGSAGGAVGNITIKNIANTVTYSQISIGLTACRQLIYTVPAGKTLFLKSLNVASGAGGNALKLNAVVFTPKVRLFGSTVFLPQGELLTLNGDVVRPLAITSRIPEKSDMKMSVIGDYSAGGTLCIGAVRGWLE